MNATTASKENQETPEKTVVFADIVGSTSLYNQVGDKVAEQIISEGIQLLKDIIEQYDGNLIKTIGDEVLVCFDEPHNAVEAVSFMSKAIQRTEFHDDLPNGNLHLRVGLHHGPVIEKDNDIFGNTVNITARIVGKSKSDQILCSKNIISQLPLGEFEHRFVDSFQLKGIHEPFEIYEIIPNEDTENMTMAMGDDNLDEFSFEIEEKFTLHFKGETYELEQNSPPLTIGRNPENKVRFSNNPKVSRLHAKIEHKNGHFYLVDMSFNGTFLTDSSGSTQHLKIKEVQLSDSGFISCGENLPLDSPNILKFELIEEIKD